MTRVVLILAALLGWAAYVHFNRAERPRLYGTQRDAFPFPTSDDRKGIDLEDEVSIKAWCQTFACTEEQLRAAIRHVGGEPASIRQHLGRPR